MFIVHSELHSGELNKNSAERSATPASLVRIINYSRFSLSRNPRDSMKHFEIPVLRHIRFAELRKTVNRTTTLASVAQLDARPTGDQEVAGLTPAEIGTSFVKIDHEIFSTVILSLTLIQEGQLSVSGERMCTILVNRLQD